MAELLLDLAGGKAVDGEWRCYWRLWCGLPGLGLTRMQALLARFTHPRTAWEASPAELAAVNGIGAGLVRRIEARRRRGPAATEADWQAAGVELITPFDPGYPALLRVLPGAPLGLFVRGSLRLPAPALAVVGTRKASTYGLEAARWVAGGLAQRGVPVISGLALGIDAAAHRAALDVEGLTYAILAHGLHTVAPGRHRELAAAIAASGALVSELAPGVEPKPWYFPVRNRIIAGICHATVVVEAGRRSGALITANMALDAGREVYAVPGSIFSRSAAGTNALIADGAVPLLDLEGLAASLGAGAPADPADAAQDGDRAAAGGDGGNDRGRQLLAQIGSEPVSFERLHQVTGWPQGRLAAALTRLELAGAIRSLPGQRYARSGLSVHGPS